MNPILAPTSRLARATILRTQSDERLAELARQGSADAFEAIVHRYRRSLLTHCAHVLGEADAEEAVQDALVNAHAALEGGSEVRSLRAWLHAVAHNAAVGMLRRRAARPEWPQERCTGRLHYPPPERARAELREVVEAVQSLPPRQRDAIVMRELEGRSYEDIAGRLGASDGAVRQLLNRARRSLRETIGALIPAEPLLRWVLASDNGSGAWRALALGGGSAVAAKLTGAAVLSAVSVVTWLSSPHGAAGSGHGSSAIDRGGVPAAELATAPSSGTRPLTGILASRSYGAGHKASRAATSGFQALAARPFRSAGAGQTSATGRDTLAGQPEGAGQVGYADVSRATAGSQIGQPQSRSPVPSTGGSGPASGPASQSGSRQAGVYNGATGYPGQQPTVR